MQVSRKMTDGPVTFEENDFAEIAALILAILAVLVAPHSCGRHHVEKEEEEDLH